MFKHYRLYQHYAPTNNKNSPVSSRDFFLLQSIEARHLPWAVVAAQGIFSVFFQTLREAQNYCLQKGYVLVSSEVTYDSFK
jgi:hypothetical protein